MDYKKKYKDAITSRIDKVLSSEKGPISELSKKTIEEILEEVNVYHQELEFQNQELMRIREELEESKHHYEDLFHNAPIGYVIFDKNSFIKNANIAFAQIVGSEQNSIINQQITYFVHPESQDDLYMFTKDIVKTKKNINTIIKFRTEGKQDNIYRAYFNTFSYNEEILIRMAITRIFEENIEKENPKQKIHDNPINNIENLSNLSFLIVEDDELSSFYLSQVLEFQCNKLFFARTGIEAVEMLKQHPDINIVLMDIKMPDMDGITATKEIRKFNNHVVIIAQTAFALSKDKQKAMETGCNEYITKPIKADKLIEIVNNYVKK